MISSRLKFDINMLTNHSPSTYRHLPLVMSCLQKNPTQVLIAIRTTDVGVATFSLTLNNKHRTEKEQISTPLPAKALNAPPTMPEIQNLYIIYIFFISDDI